ncbi:MAG TPA: hypothetical protein VFL04_07095, partial [Rectinemataceae bacterium]|nr:hypothetical protein [Rectinemataceae bacterium]
MNHRYTSVPLGTIFGFLFAMYAGLCLSAFLSAGGQGDRAARGAAAVFLVATLSLARYLVIAFFARS